MLVLSRKVGERLVVPELGVTITVLWIKGNRARLGIEAPTDVGVHREEVWRRMIEPSYASPFTTTEHEGNANSL